jgi:DNA-binding MarR family transcriptional regulator
VTGVREDSVDRHIRQWQPELPDMDPTVEAIVTRMQKLVHHLRQSQQSLVAAEGMQLGEFKTLHQLAARGAPYRSTPTELATALLLSPAAMTGRLDALERVGYVRRLHDTTDRRRVLVELTSEGREVWRRGVDRIGAVADALVRVLDPDERGQLAALLKRLLLGVEDA